MKKQIKKKLLLNKATVSDLTRDEMNRVWGATLLQPCTESCSLFLNCCPPTRERVIVEQEEGLI
jgi:hypothetical protein